MYGSNSLKELLAEWKLEHYQALFEGMAFNTFLQLEPVWFFNHIKDADDVKIILQMHFKCAQKRRKRKGSREYEKVLSTTLGVLKTVTNNAIRGHPEPNKIPRLDSSVCLDTQGSIVAYHKNDDEYVDSRKNLMPTEETNYDPGMQMEERHKLIIRNHYQFFCANLNVIDIQMSLVARAILDEKGIAEIGRVCKYEPNEKAIALMLDYIIKGGPDAFYNFQDCLKDTPRQYMVKTLAAEDIRTLFGILMLSKECIPSVEFKTHPDTLLREFSLITTISIYDLSPESGKSFVIDFRVFQQCDNLTSIYFHQKGTQNCSKVILRRLSSLSCYMKEVQLINFDIDTADLQLFLDKVVQLNVLSIVSPLSIHNFEGLVENIASSKKAKRFLVSHMRPENNNSAKRQTYFNDEYSIFHPSFVYYNFYFGFATANCKYNLRYFAFRQKKYALEYSNSSKRNWKRLYHDNNQVTLTFEEGDKCQNGVLTDKRNFPYNRLKLNHVMEFSSIDVRYPELVERVLFKESACSETSIEILFDTCQNIFAIEVEGNSFVLDYLPTEFVERITVLRLNKVDIDMPLLEKYKSTVQTLEIINCRNISMTIEELIKLTNLTSFAITEDIPLYPVANLTTNLTSPIQLPLKSLIIRNVDIGSEILVILLKSCPHLETLHLKGEYELPLSIFTSLKMLTKLTLRQVKIINDSNETNWLSPLQHMQCLTLYCLQLQSAENILLSCPNARFLTLFIENPMELELLISKTVSHQIFQKLKRLHLFINAKSGENVCLPSADNFPALETVLIRPFFDDSNIKYIIGQLPVTIKRLLIEDAIVQVANNIYYKNIEVMQLNRCEIAAEFFENLNVAFPSLKNIIMFRCIVNGNDSKIREQLQSHSVMERFTYMARKNDLDVKEHSDHHHQCIFAERCKETNEWKHRIESSSGNAVDCNSSKSSHDLICTAEMPAIISFGS